MAAAAEPCLADLPVRMEAFAWIFVRGAAAKILPDTAVAPQVCSGIAGDTFRTAFPLESVRSDVMHSPTSDPEVLSNVLVLVLCAGLLFSSFLWLGLELMGARIDLPLIVRAGFFAH
jgi:hypothetical protein